MISSSGVRSSTCTQNHMTCYLTDTYDYSWENYTNCVGILRIHLQRKPGLPSAARFFWRIIGPLAFVWYTFRINNLKIVWRYRDNVAIFLTNKIRDHCHAQTFQRPSLNDVGINGMLSLSSSTTYLFLFCALRIWRLNKYNCCGSKGRQRPDRSWERKFWLAEDSARTCGWLGNWSWWHHSAVHPTPSLYWQVCITNYSLTM